MIELFATNVATSDLLVFSVGALLALAGAFGVILSRNPVHAALSLVVTLFGVAVLFVEQSAHFLAAVQIIVYAGAIVILFLFVIMLLGVDKVESDDLNANSEKLKKLAPFAVALGLAMFGMILVSTGYNWDFIGQKSLGGQASGGSNIEKLADSIFTQYLLPFEATSLLLVVAVVGAVLLANRSRSGEK